jgi:hypothetical protein
MMKAADTEKELQAPAAARDNEHRFFLEQPKKTNVVEKQPLGTISLQFLIVTG